MYFICYDISNPKRLIKISKTLENFGLRVQYSFFQCEMKRNQLEILRNQLLDIIDEKEDRLSIYPVCSECVKNTTSIGNGSIFLHQIYMIL